MVQMGNWADETMKPGRWKSEWKNSLQERRLSINSFEMEVTDADEETGVPCRGFCPNAVGARHWIAF
jgi:hypothetical protein